jgi:hypothetical protein
LFSIYQLFNITAFKFFLFSHFKKETV